MLCRSFLVTILMFIPKSLANGKNARLLNDSIIVNAINAHRDFLICSGAAINMEYISSNQTLVDRAHELRNNVRNLTKYQSENVLRPKNCNYTYKSSSNLTTNVQMFIQKCIRDSKGENRNLSFVWNPKFTSIGCSYSSLTKPFILCVLYKSNKPSRIFRDNQADALHKYINTNSNKTGCREPHHNIKCCHLMASTRNNITREVNKIRQNYTKQNSSQLSPVDWDFSLERVAIDQFLNSDDRFLNEIGVHEFETGNDLKIRPDLDLILPELISNASKNGMIPSIYGTQLKAIGCSFFTVGGVGKFVCLFNKRDEYVSSIGNETDCNSVQWDLNLIACVIIGFTIVIFLIVVVVILYVKLVRKRQPIEIILRPRF